MAGCVKEGWQFCPVYTNVRRGFSTRVSWCVAFLAVSSIPKGAFCTEDIRTSCQERDVLPRNIVNEVREYAPVIHSIINEVVHGSERNKTYEELAFFVDTYRTRFTGTAALERSINYMVKLLKRRHLDNVHTEPARVPRWVRGYEEAWMMSPQLKKLPVLGLGYSAATAHRGITAPVLVVDSFEELQKNREKAVGKILVFNQKFVSYSASAKYRMQGPAEAAKAGAVAVLVRSVTPLSIASPHTGFTQFTDKRNRVPAASITVEDAELLKRLQNRGITPVVKLIMRNKDLPAVISRNTVAEITGREKPREVVIVSGHIDSWDVGQGAMDDGGGAFISWRALDVLRQLGLRPRRTVRSILWTAEEMGFIGAAQYFKDHGDEKKERVNIAMESDMGTFKPMGLEFSGHSERAKCVIAEVLSLFSGINATELRTGAEAPDLEQWISAGFPVASLMTDNGKYFYFHHTDGDTMTVHDPIILDLCTALWAGVAYVLADLEDSLPRR
ncbi:carboxypeptidase Q-like isoform X2 [Dermacentor albipictus]|uniref:carboxypeptidase Q-like isoform X2 n=1 Tax=Dermacentor albipictus TaxID=60249 RepID=UPI0038FC36D0